LASAAIANAQTVFNEIEPNDSKAQALANGAIQMSPGDMITGTTTGTSTGGIASADYFLVKTTPQPLGVYRYRLSMPAGTTGYTATIRGLKQPSSGVIDPNSDLAFQTGANLGGLPFTVQWYGFGKQEQLYYAVTGTASTTAPYTATLSMLPVTTTPVTGTFAAGNITITTVGRTTADTELLVYDSNFNAIANYRNDDEPSPGTTTQSKLTRPFDAGTYYLAISDIHLSNNLPYAADERHASPRNVLDYPDVVVQNNATSSTPSFTITDGVTSTPVTATLKSGFDVEWYSFTVVGSTPTGACCLGGVCSGSPGTPMQCAVAGGSYAGDGTNCATADCSSGACCNANHTCSIALGSVCTTTGGTYQGAGSTCATATCPGRFVESVDAGELPATAALPSGTGGLYRIEGTFTSSDVDMYAIQICDHANFLATTVGQTTANTQLFLFNQSGMGVASNDDEVGGTSTQSKITSQFVPSNGNYYLAVSVFNRDPMSAGGSIFGTPASRSEVAATGPGAASPVSAWTSTTATTAVYAINLTGACYVDFNATGACCQTDGTCGVSTALNCINGSGLYQGDNTACGSVTCPVAGACCLADTSCVIRTQAACAVAGGVWVRTEHRVRQLRRLLLPV
jgi:hypothetical protein